MASLKSFPLVEKKMRQSKHLYNDKSDFQFSKQKRCTNNVGEKKALPLREQTNSQKPTTREWREGLAAKSTACSSRKQVQFPVPT